MDTENLWGTSWVVCSYCNEKTEMTRCRLMSKAQPTFRCCKCCSTTPTLNRFLGAGVAQTLQKIPPAERAQFFKFARENNAGAIKEKITFLMKRHETWEKRYQSGGSYLPLSVWATQGYDTQRIERLSRPEDIMENDVLGKVYRVPVLGVWENGTKGRSLTDVTDAGPAKRRRKAAPALPPPPAEEKTAADHPARDSEPGEDSESCESSDNSNSSSESSGKHKKKKKDKKKKNKKGNKNKKDKQKARKKEREEKQRDREIQRESVKKERDDARAAAAATTTSVRVVPPEACAICATLPPSGPPAARIPAAAGCCCCCC